jgi:hypothetical protein
MGHSQIEKLPQTQEWQDIVSLIGGGGSAEQVGNAVLAAVQGLILPFANDAAVVEATWYLMRLPLAARNDDFPAALRRLGLGTGDEPDLMEVVAGTSDVIDRAIRPSHRSDLGEMAQTALVETLADLSNRQGHLFDKERVRQSLAATATVKRFGQFATTFFARIVRKLLDSFVTRAMVTHVGEGRRFRTLAHQRDFLQALAVHAREVAAGVEVYAGEWFSKRSYLSDQRISRDEAARFLSHASDKLRWALNRR